MLAQSNTSETRRRGCFLPFLTPALYHGFIFCLNKEEAVVTFMLKEQTRQRWWVESPRQHTVTRR